MTARDYKPGTVAVVTFKTDAMLNPDTQQATRWRYGWLVAYGNGDWELTHDRYVTDVRPLVVLDLSDIPGVLATLHDSLGFMYAGQPNALRLQDLIAQIEAQTRPPKPPEPTGLGAVVEDSAGQHWVRTYLRYGTGWTSGDEETGWTRYADIDAVRVLSEGVTQ